MSCSSSACFASGELFSDSDDTVREGFPLLRCFAGEFHFLQNRRHAKSGETDGLQSVSPLLFQALPSLLLPDPDHLDGIRLKGLLEGQAPVLRDDPAAGQLRLALISHIGRLIPLQVLVLESPPLGQKAPPGRADCRLLQDKGPSEAGRVRRTVSSSRSSKKSAASCACTLSSGFR